MGERMYDSGHARFLNPDPIGYGGGMNLYAYAGNNGPNSVDPTGLTEKSRLKRFMEWLDWYMEAKVESDGMGLNVDPNFGTAATIGEDGRVLNTGGPISGGPISCPRPELPKRDVGGAAIRTLNPFKGKSASK